MRNKVPAPQSAAVRQIIDETPETKSLILEPEFGHLDFVAGQFVNVTADVPGRGRVRRAYSIASSPLDPEMLLTVKRMSDGVLSPYLCDGVKPGDVVEIRGPYGVFTLRVDVRHLVFIAAGSGIVPFRSMWRYISQRGLDIRITLLYASKSLPYIIYREELEELAKHHRVVHTLTRNDDPRGAAYCRRIDRQMLLDVVGDFTGKLVYVCGPPAMCSCVREYLTDLDVPRTSIKTEKYD